MVVTGLFVPSAFAAPGDHIRLGDAVITPSVMTGLQFHSNAFLGEGGDQQPEVATLAWVLQPRVNADFSGRDVVFDLGLGYGLKKFIDFDGADGADVGKLDQFNNVSADFGLQLFPSGTIGAKLEDAFSITPTPAEVYEASETANIVHYSNDLRGGFQVRPGSAIEVSLMGNFGFDAYDIPGELLGETAGSSQYNNRLNYGPILSGTWKFLPKTSLVGMFSYNWLRWDNNLPETIGAEAAGSDVGLFVAKPDAEAWRTQWGLRGQLTERIAADVQAGYGQMYYDESSVPASDDTGGAGFDADLTSFTEGLLLTAQLGYAPLKGQTITFGYKKDFEDALFTNYVAYNYLFLRYQGLFASRLGLGAEVGYRIDAFRGEIERNDQNLDLKASASYKVADFFSVGLGGGWKRRACLDTDCTNDQFYATQYDDFSANVGLTFTY